MRPACSSARSPLRRPALRPTPTIPAVRRTASTPMASWPASRCSPRRSSSSRLRPRLTPTPARAPPEGMRAEGRERGMKIAFIADPLDSFKIYKDTTFAMMREAASRGHALYAMQQEDLLWRAQVVCGDARRIELTGQKPLWYRAGDPVRTPLAEFDAVVMRKDPPFDMEYVYS